jgi:uncharacterized membrane protein
MKTHSQKNNPKPTPGFSMGDMTQAIYLSQVMVIFFGITPLIGIILNIIKRGEAASDPFLKAHFDYQFKTFIAWIVMIGVGFLLAILVVGIPIIFAAFIWMIYRGIRGWLAFREGKLPSTKKQMDSTHETSQ